MTIFDSNHYYRLSADSYGRGYSMSTGGEGTIPHNVNMTETLLFLSDNWQLFFQEGVYFLRNYDYNNTYQLAIDISSSDRSTPVMLEATSELGHQWIISPSDAHSTTFLLKNRLLVIEQTPSSWLGNALNDIFALHMHSYSPSQGGINWTITQNPDPNVTVLPEMLTPYSTIQQNLPASQTSGAAGPSSTTASGADPFYTPGQLTPITIAGIVVGLVVFLAALTIFILFWLRHKKLGPGGIRGVPGPTPPPRHGRAELVQQPPPAYNERNSQLSQAPTLTNGLSGHNGNRSRPKQSDEVSIELPEYGRPSVEERTFV